MLLVSREKIEYFQNHDRKSEQTMTNIGALTREGAHSPLKKLTQNRKMNSKQLKFYLEIKRANYLWIEENKLHWPTLIHQKNALRWKNTYFFSEELNTCFPLRNFCDWSLKPELEGKKSAISLNFITLAFSYSQYRRKTSIKNAFEKLSKIWLSFCFFFLLCLFPLLDS